MVLPSSFTDEAVALAHDGHMGVQRTKTYLRTSVWFLKMDSKVENKVNKCLPCLSTTPGTTPEPLIMMDLPEKPWQYVAVDLFGPLPNGERLLVKDLRSKWPEVSFCSKNRDKG